MKNFIASEGWGGALVITEGWGSEIRPTRTGSGNLMLSLTRMRSVTADHYTNVYYSVGSDYGQNLATGTPYLTIDGGKATFTEAQIGDIGRGDVITCGDGSRYFIDYKINYRTWVVVDRLGIKPDNKSTTAVTSISRCFASVDAAIGSSDGITCRATGVVSAPFLGTRNLVGPGLRLHIVCYHGSGINDATKVIVPGASGTGFVTSTHHEIVVMAPSLVSDDIDSCGKVLVNFKQSSDGRGGGYRINGDDVNDAALRFQDVSASVIGIDISGNCRYGIAFTTSQASTYRNGGCRRCLIRNTGDYGVLFEGDHTIDAVIDESWIRGSIIYGQTLACVRVGDGVSTSFTCSQSVIDKGDALSTCYGISFARSDYTTALALAMFTPFVGGQPEYDIHFDAPAKTMGMAWCMGQDSFFHNPGSSWTNTAWADTPAHAVAAMTSAFSDRSSHDYRLSGIDSILYMKSFVDAYGNRYPNSGYGADAGVGLGRAFTVDMDDNIWITPETSVGAYEIRQAFDFDGTNISEVHEAKTEYYSGAAKEKWTNGQVIARSGETMARVPTQVLIKSVLTGQEFGSAISAFTAENKLFIKIKNVSNGQVSSKRKVKLILTSPCYFEYSTKTMVLPKPSLLHADIIARATSDDNFIFSYDEQSLTLKIYINVIINNKLIKASAL